MNTPSNVLLCGATGFIGRHIRDALQQAGHRVVSCRSSAKTSGTKGAGDLVTVDFCHDTQPAIWLPRLQGIDVVVNAVGVLRDTRDRPMQAIHADTPKALFEACAQAGVRRVIQVSALGIEGSATEYARTKLEAEEHLLSLNRLRQLDGVVLRPSLVFGRDGDSARLFIALARSPALLLPRAVIRAKVQPVAVQDLAQAISRLMGEASDVQGVLPCVGPAALTLGAFIASLREQMGKRPAQVAALPDLLSHLSARLGDHIPAMPWCSETLALLAQDNVAPPDLFRTVLGRAAIAPTALLREAC